MPWVNLLVIPVFQFSNIYLADLYIFVVENSWVFLCARYHMKGITGTPTAQLPAKPLASEGEGCCG